MSQTNSQDRLAMKTPENAFLRTLQVEFYFSPRLSGEVLQAAKEELVGTELGGAIRPGQIRQVVASEKAPFGPALGETEMVEITLTIDSDAEDEEVRTKEGLKGVRRGRILRLVDEALEQGGVMTQEDLARTLGVTTRTIRRDVRALKKEGHLLHTRGQLQGVGRGQTHKVRIIESWLDREGYEQIARKLHHSSQAIKRYVSTFLRLVTLHQKGSTPEEIAFLTRSSVRLVKDYLVVYEATQTVPHRQRKLKEELDRVNHWSRALVDDKKKGAMS